MNKTTLVLNDDVWLEGEAVRQLEQTAGLPGMTHAFGLPDLHPGRGTPIGAAFLAEETIYPHLVGNDIGCGMALWQTELPLRKCRPEKVAGKLKGLDDPWQGDTTAFLAERGVAPSMSDQGLGTIGGGNHFAEMQQLDTIFDEEACADLNPKSMFMMIHSGSRGLGEATLRAQIDKTAAKGLNPTEAAVYLKGHNHAVRWAEVNRELIALRIMERLGIGGQRLLDICHNSVTQVSWQEKLHWLHRKGAAPACQGPIVIPGSRGSLSYLVQPLGDGSASGFSLAHGAGRKWNRSSAKERMKRFNAESLKRTRLGNLVICENKDLLYEEAPQAYKSVDSVVKCLSDMGLIKPLASLKPLVTYKTRRRK